MAKLSDRIKQLRIETDLTQEQFGDMFGIVKSTVSLYESGKSSPDDELKAKICKKFNVSLDWLLGLTNDRRTADMVKEEISAYHTDPMLDDLLKKVPDLTDEEKESLSEHMEFAMKQIEKERARRAALKDGER